MPHLKKQLPKTWRPLSLKRYKKLDYKWKQCLVYIVIAQTDIEKGHRGINALIIERNERFYSWPKENKLGIRGSDTHSLMFTDVKVPKTESVKMVLGSNLQ